MAQIFRRNFFSRQIFLHRAKKTNLPQETRENCILHRHRTREGQAQRGNEETTGEGRKKKINRRKVRKQEKRNFRAVQKIKEATWLAKIFFQKRGMSFFLLLPVRGI
jgi:hypothetical protein